MVEEPAPLYVSTLLLDICCIKTAAKYETGDTEIPSCSFSLKTPLFTRVTKVWGNLGGVKEMRKVLRDYNEIFPDLKRRRERIWCCRRVE